MRTEYSRSHLSDLRTTFHQHKTAREKKPSPDLIIFLLGELILISHMCHLDNAEIYKGEQLDLLSGSPAKIRSLVLEISEPRELLLQIGIIRLIIRDNLQLARSKQSYSTEHKLNIFITRQRGRRRRAAVKPGQLKVQLE